jgi:RNA polymerase sigma-70 factor (ECF subfamily)
MTQPEQDLVDRIRRRDAEALAQFVELKSPQLLAFIQKRMSGTLRRKVEPADILQELSSSAVASLGDMDLSKRDPFSWLCQQAERRIIDAHRKHIGAQKRSSDREVGLESSRDDSGGLAELIVASMTSPSHAFTRQQREFYLLEALQELPAEAREAIRLRYLEGWESKQIADHLGKSDGAVRVLLSRTLTRLQETLAKNNEFQTLMAQAMVRGQKPEAKDQ